MGAPETDVVESMMIWVTPAWLGVFQQINPQKAGTLSTRFRNKLCFSAFMLLPLLFHAINNFISYIVYKFSHVKNRGMPQRSARVTPAFELSRTRIVDRNNSRSRGSQLTCFANTCGKGARLPADQP